MRLFRKGRYTLVVKHAFKKTPDGGNMFIVLAGIFNPVEGIGITIMNISIMLGWNKQK